MSRKRLISYGEGFIDHDNDAAPGEFKRQLIDRIEKASDDLHAVILLVITRDGVIDTLSNLNPSAQQSVYEKASKSLEKMTSTN